MRLTVDQVHINRVPVEIPLEILAIICSHLDKLSIKCVRLVCQTFSFAASPYLFTRAHTSVHPFDLDILLKISEHPIFSKSVRELVSHVRRLDVGMTKRETYVKEMQNHFDAGYSPPNRISRIDLTRAVVDEGHERYCELYRQQEQSQETEVQRKCLCIILPKMPNIQALSFAYSWGPLPTVWKGWDQHAEHEPCSPLVRLWNPLHPRPRLRHMSLDASTPGGLVKTELPVIIEALSQSGLHTMIKSLDVGGDLYHEICDDGLDKYLPLDCVSSVFTSLTSINIVVQESRFSGVSPFGVSHFAQLLNNTKTLKFLALEFLGVSFIIDNPEYTSLKGIIGKSLATHPHMIPTQTLAQDPEPTLSSHSSLCTLW